MGVEAVANAIGPASEHLPRLRVVLHSSASGATTAEFTEQIRKYPIYDRDGTRIADLYGYILHGWTGQGISIAGDGIRWSGVASDIDGFEREIIEGVHGAFVIVTCDPLPPRLYLDSGGQLPIVYDAQARQAGCSANDLLDESEYSARLNRDRVDRLIVREGGSGWIAGSLTAHNGISRLLPNHYLDLISFRAVRHWPPLPSTHDLAFEEAVERVARALKGYVTAAASEARLALTLTAGYDSRLLLAAAAGVKDSVEFITMTPPKQGLDQIVSQELARKLGLKHRLILIRNASPAGQAQWDRLVGEAIREVNRTIHPTLASVDEELLLTGMYGETGRCRLYRQNIETVDAEPATVSFILSRLTLPLDAELIADIETWLDPIRDLPRSMVLDLAFNELKFGSWAMGQAPVQKALKMSLAPFAQRIILDAFMRVKPVEKGTTKLFDEIGRRLWPEAMREPINRYGGLKDITAPILKVFNPGRVRRYLRDRLAAS